MRTQAERVVTVSTEPPEDQWLDARVICAWLGISRTTLWRWQRQNFGFPKSVRLGPNTARFSRRSIEQWINTRERRTHVAGDF
jgi:predicted DNA-binding transcriptional regulator AlpA